MLKSVDGGQTNDSCPPKREDRDVFGITDANSWQLKASRFKKANHGSASSAFFSPMSEIKKIGGNFLLAVSKCFCFFQVVKKSADGKINSFQ